MKIRSKRIYSTDQELLIKLREEYALYGDFRTTLEKGCLIIHTTRKPREKNKRRGKRK